jgi:hypothetical protein
MIVIDMAIQQFYERWVKRQQIVGSQIWFVTLFTENNPGQQRKDRDDDGEIHA